jgi:RNA polymerase sigma-70 factor (ECF subfamily)
MEETLTSYAGSLGSFKTPRLNSKPMSDVKSAQNSAINATEDEKPAAKKSTKSAAQKALEFEQMAIPLMPQVYGMALRWTKNPSDAEDLVQDTFAKAFNAWDQFEQGTNLKAWIFRILTNTQINSYNKKAKDQAKVSIDQFEEWQLGDVESLTSLASRSAELEALDRLPADIIKKSLSELGEFQQVVELAVIAEMPYAAIAEELGIPVGTVMSRLHRGKKKLREKLLDYAIQEGYVTEPKKNANASNTTQDFKKGGNS